MQTKGKSIQWQMLLSYPHPYMSTYHRHCQNVPQYGSKKMVTVTLLLGLSKNEQSWEGEGGEIKQQNSKCILLCNDTV